MIRRLSPQLLDQWVRSPLAAPDRCAVEEIQLRLQALLVVPFGLQSPSSTRREEADELTNEKHPRLQPPSVQFSGLKPDDTMVPL